MLLYWLKKMAEIFVHNTLTGKKEPFHPQDNKNVNMYVCGITPYDECHLGHARCYVAFDFIRRYFEYSGYSVKYIQNFTDVDDKIIKRSTELKISPSELTEKYIQKYFEFCNKLNIKKCDSYPRVTGHMPDIIKSVQTLVDKGYAYAAEGGDVYFSVRKFKDYGKLSKRKLEELIVGARVEPGENKKDPLDFAIWKSSKPDEPAEVSWDSPWGKGRPGWHIECSVMSTKYLGETLDVHGGGEDLIFPHHENEIAQSESATGKPFAKYWLHNGFVTLNQEKMSKSLGNFFTLEDIFKKYDPMVVRFLLVSQHYRKPIDFSYDKLEQSDNSWKRLVRAKKIAEETLSRTAPGKGAADTPGGMKRFDEFIKNFESAMDDDFNTSGAMAAIHGIANELYGCNETTNPEIIKLGINKLKQLSDVLGLIFPGERELEDTVQKLIKERETARENKDWKKADKLREEINSLGVVIEDTSSGTRWWKKE